MEETIATTEPQPFRGEDWFDPLEGRFASEFAASSRRCWRRNWTPPCSVAAMVVVARRMGIATATVSAT